MGHTCTNMYISAAQSDACLVLLQKQRSWRRETCSTQRLPWVLTTPLAYSTSCSRQVDFRWCSYWDGARSCLASTGAEAAQLLERNMQHTKAALGADSASGLLDQLQQPA